MLGERIAADQQDSGVVDQTSRLSKNLPDVDGGTRVRAGPVVLNPLAEVEVGMQMPVMIRCCELMMHAERHAEGRHQEHGREGGKSYEDAEAVGGSHDRGMTFSATMPPPTTRF